MVIMFTCRNIIPLAIKTKVDQHTYNHVYYSNTSRTSNLIDYHGDWPDSKRQQFPQHMQILKDYITEHDEYQLIQEISPLLRRLPYECNHWDNAIQHYRELELNQWNNTDNQALMKRIRQTAFKEEKNMLPHVHILDLAAEGVIKPHIDSKRFCGHIIAGLSLLSDSVMRLIPENKQNFYFADLFLPRRSLYIMSDMARYQFTHEILSQQLSNFMGQPVIRSRRLSLIFRLEPQS